MADEKKLMSAGAIASLYRRESTCRTWRENLALLRELLRPQRGRFWLMAGLTFAAVGAEGGLVLLTRGIVDRVALARDTAALAGYGISMLLLSGALLLAQWGIGWLGSRLGSDLASSLRARLHAHALELPVGFFDRTQPGKVSAVILQDTMSLERFVIEQLPFILVNVAMALGFGALLFWLDAWLGLIALLPLPLLAVGSLLLNRRRHALLSAYFSLNDRMNTTVQETVQGIKPIKAACRQAPRARDFAECSAESGEVEFGTNWVNVFFSNLMTWVMTAATVGVWLVGANRIAGGALPSVGTLVAFVGVVRLFHTPLQFTARMLHQSVGALASLGRIGSFLDSPPERHPEAAGAPVERPRGRIEFENVSFSYVSGAEVIRGVSFAVEPGEIVGLVGRSGAGKTTLTSLVCRFYDPDSGRILVDGRDVAGLDLAQYRPHLGIVLQEPFLFRASIADNIRYARPDATPEQVVAAAEQAQAHEFIAKLERGYDTCIGDRGVRLSVGQTQRIALARAILQDPAILILDEATSNLDAETEAKIQQAILELIRNRTTIAIAHRLSTLRHATRLLVIDDGRLVETGTHDELASRPGGVYAALVRAQTEQNRAREEREVWQM